MTHTKHQGKGEGTAAEREDSTLTHSLTSFSTRFAESTGVIHLGLRYSYAQWRVADRTSFAGNWTLAKIIIRYGACACVFIDGRVRRVVLGHCRTDDERWTRLANDDGLHWRWVRSD